MHSRNEYLKVIRERYLKAETKKEKTAILDEYCSNTDQARKYVIRKIQGGVEPGPKKRKRRKENYDGQISAALVKVWEIFDYPCGQRLKPILDVEVDRLRKLGELEILDKVAMKLKVVSSATIDRKLKHQREVLQLSRSRNRLKPGSILLEIPIRLTQWDTSKVGYIEADLVMHCGSTTQGEHINTLSTTEIYSGWWEGKAIMGKSQEKNFKGIKEIRERTPFDWMGLDSDNGPEFINSILYRYCIEEKIEFTRSRPNKKNDNAYIEQKNWTHVRKILGYLRYDTLEELIIINELYSGPLRLYKNFFQPVMKLISKVRVGGHVKRKYDMPQTPYQRLMNSGQISEDMKLKLKAIYESLNPAQLKREIQIKLEELNRTYEKKRGTQNTNPQRRLVPQTVTSLMIQRYPVGLPS